MARALSPRPKLTEPLQVLALNSGSSSLKYGLFEVDKGIARLLIGGEADGITKIAATIAAGGRTPPKAIGHRIVHGGPRLLDPCLIDQAVLRELDDATGFAPLHIPASLALIRASTEHFPSALQVACFDTHFHAGLPDLARALPIPRSFEAEGIRRYGFHGLSCESIVNQLGNLLPSRLVIAHLGNGASITAVRDGHSIDTSMGLTPSGGVIMGTRSGDLDPGVLLYLLRSGRFNAQSLETFLDRDCGLLGISGLSSDMRVLGKAAADGHSGAGLAIRMFSLSVQKQIVAMITALGGIDTLVFTGGIGEHDAKLRDSVCNGLAWAGVLIDDTPNTLGSTTISKATSSCRIQVLPSNENERIAATVGALVSA